jgi:hypothetical protein
MVAFLDDQIQHEQGLESTDLLSSHGLDAQSQVTKDIQNAIQMLVAVLYTQHRLRVQLSGLVAASFQ